MKKSVVWGICLIGLIYCPQTLAQSQATTGVIEGRVLAKGDETPLAGATIELVNIDTNYRKEIATKENGRFRGLLLPLGPYEIKASLDGYYIARQEGFNVTVGKTIDVDIYLQKIDDAAVTDLLSQLDSLAAEEQAEIMEEITVTSEDYAQVIEVDRIESSTQISEEAVQGLPNNGRNFLDFVELTPGVTIVQGPDGEELSINGQKGINNNIAVDGADFNNPFFGEQRGGQRPAFTFNLDAVQEVVVVADGAPAEFGRSSSGFVNVITKSGTNQTEGSAHIFFKDNSLNSRATQPDGSKADDYDFEQKQIGFTVGGPLIKDKMFYFIAFDYQDGESTKQTDPNRIEPRIVEFFDNLGIPNENAPITRTNDAHAFLGKVDWNLNVFNLLTIRINNTWSEQINGTFDVDSWGASANAVEQAESRSINGQLNSVLGDAYLNEMRFQWSREDRPRPYDGPTLADGRPLPDTAFDFGRGYRFGMPFFIPVEYYDTRLQFNDNLSIIADNHLIKMGVEVNYTEATQTFVGFANGRWIFSSTDGFLNYAGNPNYVECSDGSFSHVGQCPPGTEIVGPLLFYLQQAGVGGLTAREAGTQTIDTLEPGIFIQDKWDVSSSLTIQYGLRWEAQYHPEVITPPEEVFFAPFIGTTREGMEFPSDGTIPDDTDMWQPRLGITWDPEGDGKSVFRASWGIYYARLPGLILASTRSTNGSRGQSIFRSSNAAPFLGAAPAYPNLLPTDNLGEPQFPDVFVFDKHFRNPRSMQTTFAYEREIAPGTSAGIKYTYIDGDHQTRFINRNDPLLGSPWSSGLGADGNNGVNNLTVVESTGEALYRGLTFNFNKHFGNGLSVQANYTYSKDKSHDDNERDPFTFRYARVTDLDAEWSWSDRDQRHRGSLWALYDSPWWGLNFNVRWTYRSPQPKSVTASGADVNTPQDRINPDGSITPRNLGRKDNKYNSIDIRIAKTFTMNRVSLEAVLEVFNLANNENFLAPETTNLIFNFDGTVQSGAGNPRQIQLGLKSQF